jgi:phenylacetate-coenzyme A ligase PaaK-like adenylate-forming protein
MQNEWYDKIFRINKENFDILALEIFRLQYDNNPVYKNYTDALKINPALIKSVEQIPFLPVRFFKSHEIKTTSFNPQVVFESSGTTGSINSRHLIKDLFLYEESFINGFVYLLGPAKN